MILISKLVLVVNSFSFVSQVLVLPVLDTCRWKQYDIPTLSILFSLYGEKVVPLRENLSLYSVVHS